MNRHMQNLFSSFRYRNYRWLWLIVALTNTASWSFTLGATWQVFSLTSSSFWSGTIVFAAMVPNLIAAPVVGVLVDRMERRRLILIAISLAIAVLITFTILTMTNSITPIGMVLLSFAFGLASSSINVSVNAILPSIVPKEGLYNAYSLQSVAQSGTEFIGPFVASALLALVGAQAVYLFAALTYATAVWFVILLVAPHASTVVSDMKPIGFLGQLLEGFSYIRRSRDIARLIALVGLHCALTMAFLGVLPEFVKLELGAQPGFYGILVSMVGLGAIFGTLLLGGVTSLVVRMRLFWASALISGLSLAFLGVSRSDALAVIAILLIGASQALFMTLSISFVQEATEEKVRGRVTGVYFVLAAGLMSIANWAYGALGTVIPSHDMMIGTGLLFVLCVGAYKATTTVRPILSTGVAK